MVTSKKSGFTLIEMFIVIAVIGILVGLVFRGTAGVQSSARDTRRIGDLRNVQNYLELYFNKCGHYPGGADCSLTAPTTWDQLVTALGSVTSSTNVPRDPVPSKNYFYSVESTNYLGYLLGAQLEKDNKALQGDVDTIPTGWSSTTGADCTDASPNFGYCIQS